MFSSPSKILMLSFALCATTLSAASQASWMEPSSASAKSPPLLRVHDMRNLVNRAREDHQSRRLDDVSFADACSFFEVFLEADGEFTCTCNNDTNTLTCTSQQVCENGECAVVSIELDFTDGGELDYMKTCVTYVGVAAALYPDLCVRADLDPATSLSSFESCVVELEKDGVLQECQTCEPCTVDGLEGLNLDCSNLYEGATTGGCLGDGEDAAGSVQDTSATRVVQERASEADTKNNGSAAASYWMSTLGMALGLAGIACLI